MINFGQLGWYLSAGNKKYDPKRLKQVEGWFVNTKLEIWIQASKGQQGHSSAVFKDSSGYCVPDLLCLSYDILFICHNIEPPPLNVSGFQKEGKRVRYERKRALNILVSLFHYKTSFRFWQVPSTSHCLHGSTVKWGFFFFFLSSIYMLKS